MGSRLTSLTRTPGGLTLVCIIRLDMLTWWRKLNKKTALGNRKSKFSKSTSTSNRSLTIIISTNKLSLFSLFHIFQTHVQRQDFTNKLGIIIDHRVICNYQFFLIIHRINLQKNNHMQHSQNEDATTLISTSRKGYMALLPLNIVPRCENIFVKCSTWQGNK